MTGQELGQKRRGRGIRGLATIKRQQSTDWACSGGHEVRIQEEAVARDELGGNWMEANAMAG